MSKQKSTPRPRDARGRFVKRTRRNVDFGDVHPIRDSAGYAEWLTGSERGRELRARHRKPLARSAAARRTAARERATDRTARLAAEWNPKKIRGRKKKGR